MGWQLGAALEDGARFWGAGDGVLTFPYRDGAKTRVELLRNPG